MAALPLIVEPDELEAHLDGRSATDRRPVSPERYAAGHIPGAVYVHPQETQAGRPPAPGPAAQNRRPYSTWQTVSALLPNAT